MSRYRGTDTSHLLISSAVAGAAVVGTIDVATSATGEIVSAYREYIAAGGRHIPELLLIPFLVLLVVIIYSTLFLASTSFPLVSSLNGFWPRVSSVALIGFICLIWFSVIGTGCGSLSLAGEGAVLNAIAPLLMVACYSALRWGPVTGITTFFVWAGTRFILAIAADFRCYRAFRSWLMAASAFGLVALPPLILVFRTCIDQKAFSLLAISVR